MTTKGTAGEGDSKTQNGAFCMMPYDASESLKWLKLAAGLEIALNRGNAGDPAL